MAKHSNSELIDKLRVLTPQQILKIDLALQKIGAFGEVRLIKKAGQLRFIEQVQSSSFDNESPLEKTDSK
jgi:hypothetical protein